MTKDDAFDTIVAEFAKDMELDLRFVRYRFPAVAKNGASYLVHVGFKGKDYLTGEPLSVRVVVWQGPVLIHSGSWFPSDAAITAAKAAVAAVRDTGYIVQGELL